MQDELDWSSPRRARLQSTYTTRRSESPSIYSGHFEVSPRSSFDDLCTRPHSEATERNADQSPYASEDETQDPPDDSPHTLLSAMGPTTRVYSRAPWEVGEDVLHEEDEDHAESRSIMSRRGRSKKSKDKDSSSLTKGVGLAAFASAAMRRSSSAPRPSTDTQGFSSSTSSNYSTGNRPSFSSNLRPDSSFTSHSEYPLPNRRGGANMVNGHHHHHNNRSPLPSPRSLQNGRSPTDSEIPRAVHPYANPDILPQTSAHQPHGQHEQVDGESILLSLSPSGSSGGLNQIPSPSDPHHPHVSRPLHVAASPTHHLSSAPMPLASPHEKLPAKMAPWQHVPGSPTFQLLSLEEAQALKAKQRSAAASSTSNSSYIRGRTVSGNTAQERFKSHTLAQDANEFEDSPKSTHLKTRRSILGIFAKKEKDRLVTPRASSPPPPVPSLPPSIPGTPSGLAPQLEISPLVPQSPRRIPPPSLNIVANSPSTSTTNDAKENKRSSPLTSPKHQQAFHSSSALSSPSVVATPQPRKKGSLTGLGSRAPLAKPPSINPNPGSTPSSVAFPALQVRPISTMFSSLPSDYLSGATSPPVPALPFRVTADPPSTPGFSSRSASISTGSSDMGPQTPADHHANSTVLLQLRDQVNGAREVWKSQVSDLEAQVRALKKEIEELKATPCEACGYMICATAPNGEMKTSVLNRPRAKTATGGRTLFGGDD